MRNICKLGFWLALITLCLSCVSVGYAEEIAESPTRLYIRIGGKVLSALLADNSSASALADLLKDGGITIDMHRLRQSGVYAGERGLMAILRREATRYRMKQYFCLLTRQIQKPDTKVYENQPHL